VTTPKKTIDETATSGLNMGSFPECEHLTGRLRAICRNEAGLPLDGPNGVNHYRVDLWSLQPIDNISQRETLPDGSRKPTNASQQITTTNPLRIGLGDVVESVLKRVGITEERVSAWLGRPCGCSARKEKLNALVNWANQYADGNETEPPIE